MTFADVSARLRARVLAAAVLCGSLAITVSAHEAQAAPPSDAVTPVAARTVTSATSSPVPEDAPGQRMNIVLITSDDQRFDEMPWMPRTRRLIGAQGVTFDDALSPHPMCCPARAEILTGEYAQNNGVRHNTGPWGGFPAFIRKNRIEHLGTWLQRAGYNTAFIGKFLNGYADKYGDQRGWTKWNPTTAGTYNYTNFTMRIDGRPVRFDMRRSPKQYVTDVDARRAAQYVDEFSRSPKPFFMWVSNVGPHDASRKGTWGPPIPAPRHRDLFAGSRPAVLDQPNYLEADVSDKPQLVLRRQTRNTAGYVRSHLARIRTLQAIDQSNARIIRALDRAGELQNTLVVFTSDNGYMQGENGLNGKNWPYESSLRVPLLVRGPGIPAGEHRSQNVTIVDLAPTFLAAAGASRSSTDGDNLFPVLRDDAPTSNTSLIQAGAATDYGWLWRGVRTSRYVYVEWTTGERELYDLQEDPYELQNLVDPQTGVPLSESYAPVLADMQRRYAALESCAGEALCQADLGPMVEPAG